MEEAISEPVISISKIKQGENYNVYMKEYMKKHYHTNHDKVRKYRNSLNYKKKNNVSEDDCKKYGIHLYNVMKLKELLNEIPPELINDIMQLRE